MKRHFATAVLSMSLALSGCSSLLPRGTSDMSTPFRDFAQAQAAVDRVVPFTTRTSELAALGLDPEQGRNVTLIAYPEIVARLAPYSGVPLSELDPGVRHCILAKTACKAYLFRFERQERRREGVFLADFLNIRRVTRSTGWWFESLIVVSDGVVLFRNVAGQPHTARLDRQTNPLGPLQSAGEGVGTHLLD
jgi:hypothetical protein